jgi:hypothetical protein
MEISSCYQVDAGTLSVGVLPNARPKFSLTANDGSRSSPMSVAATRFRNGHGGNAVLDGFLALADAWIARTADAAGITWFREAVDKVVHAADDRALGAAIGLAPRKLGRADLALTSADGARAADLRPGFDPHDWSIDQLARVALMAASHEGDDAAFATRFDGFCATAEVNELIALARGLPIYPGARLLEPRAREAVRSGMKPVFEAVAHRNPYPREIFAEDPWNHMVVKALFIGSSLWPIQGLDQRANPHLARMLVDFAHERWAAGRTVSPELWRCVAPHADAQGIAALRQAFDAGGDKDRLAVALAVERMEAAGLLPLRDEIERLRVRLADERIAWRDLA